MGVSIKGDLLKKKKDMLCLISLHMYWIFEYEYGVFDRKITELTNNGDTKNNKPLNLWF